MTDNLFTRAASLPYQCLFQPTNGGCIDLLLVLLFFWILAQSPFMLPYV